MSQNDNHILSKLMENFSTLAVSIARIEEAVKPIASMKEDMQDLKRDMASVEASSKSSHLRIDALEAKMNNTPSKERVDNIEEDLKEVKSDIKKLVWTIVVIIIGAIMKEVLVGG